MGNSFVRPEPIGYRKPGTEPGTWDNAFVAGKQSSLALKWTAASFEHGMDFVGAVTDEELKKTLDYFVKEGWQPMTREDIKLTAGI
jgi:hypothetical protein